MLARHVVLISSSAGAFCSGIVIASELVLTAGHCADPANSYKLVQFSMTGAPVFFDVTSTTRHPQFNINAYNNHRATADVALMKLARPLPPPYSPAPLASSEAAISVGDRLTVVGYGVSTLGDGKTGGTLRAALLTVTGRPGTLQIRLVDPKTTNTSPGVGACTGDSGSPAFDSSGAVFGIVSWSTAPNNEDGCGGLTGLTPLATYRKWIAEKARALGAQ